MINHVFFQEGNSSHLLSYSVSEISFLLFFFFFPLVDSPFYFLIFKNVLARQSDKETETSHLLVDPPNA